MIKPKSRNTNLSRDVEGPKLMRPYDEEMQMKNAKGADLGKHDLYGDSAPTGAIQKYSLSDLHYGDHETPLTASGQQDVVVSVPMGQDKKGSAPKVAKSSGLGDEQHEGKKKPSYRDTSKSVTANPHNPTPEMNRNAKGMGRSVGKDLISAMKKKAKY